MTDQYTVKAGEWDEIPWKIELAREVYDAICRKVKIRPDTRLIDFGGGTGLLTLKFRSRVSKIIVVDTSEAMLAEYVHDGFESAALRIPLRKAGFKNIEIETFASITRKTDSGDTKNYPLLMVTAENA